MTQTPPALSEHDPVLTTLLKITAAQDDTAPQVSIDLDEAGWRSLVREAFRHGVAPRAWTRLREAQVIVLDEPTSAMDAAAEYEMFKRFRDVAAGRTAILISHRLSTVKMADRIYVVHAGRIVESGTHDELLRKAGAYADLFTAQASGYH